MISAKQYISIPVLIGMLLQINCVFVYYGLFRINQKAIAENLCEKKTMHCGGHCFLKKKIDAVSDTQQATPEKQSSTKTLEEMLNTMHGLLPDNRQSTLTASAVYRNLHDHAPCLSDGAILPIDQPPEA
jgi:hypothetical protein